jgi:hypothetical protein
MGVFMRTFVLAIAAAAALTASPFSSDAKAMTIGNAAGLQQVIDDADLTEKVHCCHRRLRRVYYRRVIIIVPRYYVYRRRCCCC